MRKSKIEPVLKSLRDRALASPHGYANMQCHGSNIEAVRRGEPGVTSIRFRIDGRHRSQFDIAAWLNEKAEEERDNARRVPNPFPIMTPALADEARMPLGTDAERLDFAMQTGAEWKRDKYRTSGVLTWFGRGVNAIECDGYRQALDQAIRAFKLEGGVILTPMQRAYDVRPPVRDPKQPAKALHETVIIHGPQGCGKTVYGPLFAAHYGGHCMDFDIFDKTTDKNVRVLLTQSIEEARHAQDWCSKHCFQRPRIVEFSQAVKECSK